MDKVIAANMEAIAKIDKEILNFSQKKPNDATKKESSEAGKVKHTKKCRYFNRGYCKYKHNCKYLHPKEICKEYLVGGTCGNLQCCARHPRACKWNESNEGCKRKAECDYLHVTSASQTSENYPGYKCASCKDTWENSACVVEHKIQNMKVFFCLNWDQQISGFNGRVDFALQ